MRAVISTALQNAPRGTQTRIADALGVRVQTVNKWAKGYNLPEPQHLPQLEQLLRLKKGALQVAGAVAIRPDTSDIGRLTQLVADTVAEVRDLRAEVAQLGVAVATLSTQPPAQPPSEGSRPAGASRARKATTRSRQPR